MGKEKAGFLTPKAIANRIKSKGLQKLRWYCQMCQKQCRDENGFKCHCMSEAHQRQLLLFAENSQEYLDGFSKEFMESFVELLRRRYGTRRIHCNIVYNEFIADKDHSHMNATQWSTLTDFIMYLGKEGMVTVDPTEKGIFITYIDRDPETIRRQEILLKREKFEALEAEKADRQLEEQVARGNQQARPIPQTVFTELTRDDDSAEKIKFSLAGSASSGSSTAQAGTTAAADDDDDRESQAATVATCPTAAEAEDAAAVASAAATTGAKSTLAVKVNPLEEAAKKAKLAKQTSSTDSRKRKSALEEIIEEEERRKKRRMPPPPSTATASSSKAPSTTSPGDSPTAWLLPGIVVKVVNKRSEHYKTKGTVTETRDRGHTALIRLQDGDVVRLPDSDLETVIPAIGRSVLMLKGEYRGMEAILEKIDVDNFCVNVTVVRKMKSVKRVPYEEVSKLAAK